MQITSRQWRWLTFAVVIAVFLYATGPEAFMLASLLDSIGIDVFIALVGFQFLGIFASTIRPWFQDVVRRYLERASRFLFCFARAIPNVGAMTQATRVAVLFAVVFAGKAVLLGARLLERIPDS